MTSYNNPPPSLYEKNVKSIGRGERVDKDKTITLKYRRRKQKIKYHRMLNGLLERKT